MALRPQPSLRPILCGAGASLGALAATGLNQPALAQDAAVPGPLQTNAVQLDTVVLTPSDEQSSNTNNASTGIARLPASVRDTPQVVNVVPAEIIEQQKATTLEEALRSKQIAGAGLDVFSKEPPAMDHPLLQFDNVIASPHTAGVTKEARANMGKFAAEQLILTFDGKRPPRMVNPEVWPAFAKRFERTFGIRPGD